MTNTDIAAALAAETSAAKTAYRNLDRCGSSVRTSDRDEARARIAAAEAAEAAYWSGERAPSPRGQSAIEHADALIASARGPLPERVLTLIGRAAIAGLLPARPGEPLLVTSDEHVTSVTWSCGPLRLHVSQDVGDDTLHAVCYDGGHAVMTGERAADVYSARVAALVAYRGGR